MISLVLVGLFAVGTYAQTPYSCGEGECAANFATERRDYLGCQYFCYLDANNDNGLGRFEVQIAFRTWNNGAATCDRTCFVSNYNATIPVCESEANAAFDSMSTLGDTDDTSVSNNDVNAYYAVLEGIQGSTPVGPDAFREQWLQGYLDPECDIPFP